MRVGGLEKAKIARERLPNYLNLALYLDQLIKTWEKGGTLWLGVFFFYKKTGS